MKFTKILWEQANCSMLAYQRIWVRISLVICKSHPTTHKYSLFLYKAQMCLWKWRKYFPPPEIQLPKHFYWYSDRNVVKSCYVSHTCTDVLCLWGRVYICKYRERFRNWDLWWDPACESKILKPRLFLQGCTYVIQKSTLFSSSLSLSPSGMQ